MASFVMSEVENWATHTLSSRKAPSLTHRGQKSLGSVCVEITTPGVFLLLSPVSYTVHCTVPFLAH